MRVEVTGDGDKLAVLLDGRDISEDGYLTEHDLRDLEAFFAARRAMSTRCGAEDGEHTCGLARYHSDTTVFPARIHVCRACDHAWDPVRPVTEAPDVTGRVLPVTAPECWPCPLLSRPRCPAAYVWVSQDGREFPVCAECCARWRRWRWQLRHDSPGDMPARIYSVTMTA